MKKEEIAFMLKNGFTIGEIMALNGEQERGQEQEQEREQEQEQETEQEQEQEHETETELVKTLKAELAKMREERQKQNRKNNIISKLPENEKTEEQILDESIKTVYENSLK